MRTISHFINGRSVTRTGAVTSPVYDPSTRQVQASLEHADAAVVAEAVAAAKAAQPAWAANNPQHRARVMFRLKALLEEHNQEVVHLMSSEHGKLLSDSMGELQRGLDVVEFICGVPHLQKGEFTQGPGHRCGQRIHPEAVGARTLRSPPSRRTRSRSGRATGRCQRGAGGPGGWRGDHGPSGH